MDREKHRRMVLCWKCANAVMVEGYGVETPAEIFCTMAVRRVSDMFNPPPECPVAKKWKEDDDAGQAS